MLSAKKHKYYTASMDAEAEKLLDDTLRQMAQDLAGSDFCVVLGGSYARGEGGVRKEREKGLLFNDLDFFVFTEKSPMPDEKILRELSEKYHALLHVDVDFSRPADCRSLKKNARRLMMQELKRNYVPVYGKDLLAEHLPELPAELLPFEEACRLLLNRGMGPRLASEKLAQNSADGDFILRRKTGSKFCGWRFYPPQHQQSRSRSRGCSADQPGPLPLADRPAGGGSWKTGYPANMEKSLHPSG